jgi:hypothetical protein
MTITTVAMVFAVLGFALIFVGFLLDIPSEGVTRVRANGAGQNGKRGKRPRVARRRHA